MLRIVSTAYRLPTTVVQGLVGSSSLLMPRGQLTGRPTDRPCSDVTDHKPISRYDIPAASDLPQDMQTTMEEVLEKTKFLPNVFKVLSRRPKEFRAFFEYYDAIMNKESGNLSMADREMIVVATSSNNSCLYCVVAHSAVHRLYSKSPTLADQITINWRCSDLDERSKAILEFAMVVAEGQPLQEHHFVSLEKHGLDREDAWDIGSVAAFFALSNRMAHVTDMKPNEEFYLMGRIPKAKKKD